MTDPFIVVVAIVTVIILMVGWVLSGVWHRSQEELRELREEIAELKEKVRVVQPIRAAPVGLSGPHIGR